MICTLKTEYQETRTKMNNKPLQSDYEIELSQSVIESFARFLASEIRKYYSVEFRLYNNCKEHK